MKKVLKPGSICILMIHFVLLSCSPDKAEKKHVIYQNTAGIFVVVNTDTGKELTLYDLALGEKFELTAHNGETLSFKFTPDEQNRKYTFDVSVDINGKSIKLEKTTAEETYSGEYAITNMESGESIVKLAAKYEHEDDESNIKIYENGFFTLKIEQ